MLYLLRLSDCDFVFSLSLQPSTIGSSAYVYLGTSAKYPWEDERDDVSASSLDRGSQPAFGREAFFKR